jgi:hypothetical protein
MQEKPEGPVEGAICPHCKHKEVFDTKNLEFDSGRALWDLALLVIFFWLVQIILAALLFAVGIGNPLLLSQALAGVFPVMVLLVVGFAFALIAHIKADRLRVRSVTRRCAGCGHRWLVG